MTNTVIPRTKNDTVKSYAALLDYAAMGPARSLSLLATAYRDRTDVVPTRQESRLGFWSAKHDWQQRVAVYDAAAAADAEADRAELRQQRRRQLEDLDFSQGMDLRMRCAELLAEMPRFIRHTENEIRQNGELVKVITLALRAGPGELARALKLASEIQRLSVGVATEHIEHSGAIQFSYEQAVKDMGETDE